MDDRRPSLPVTTGSTRTEATLTGELGRLLARFEQRRGTLITILVGVCFLGFGAGDFAYLAVPIEGLGQTASAAVWAAASVAAFSFAALYARRHLGTSILIHEHGIVLRYRTHDTTLPWADVRRVSVDGIALNAERTLATRIVLHTKAGRFVIPLMQFRDADQLFAHFATRAG